MMNLLQKIWIHVTWRRVILLILMIAVLQLLASVVGFVTRKPWTEAFKEPGTVKNISVAYEKDKEWANEQPDIIQGAAGHWIGENWVDRGSSTVEMAWYDGKIIAKGKVIYDLTISRDGLHYAYLQMDYPNTSYAQLFVDGIKLQSGTDMDIVHIPNDPSHIYFSCENCGVNGSSSGMFRGDEKIAELNIVSDYEFDDLSASLCLDRSAEYVKKMFLEINESTEAIGFSCSRNGKYVLKDVSKPRFIVGSYSSISINGWGVVDGNIIDAVVDDNGHASYLNSDGRGRGEFVIAGGRYTFNQDVEGGNLGFRFDPARRHLAVPFSVSREWWYDGQPTGAQIGDAISLEGDSFYIYRIIQAED